MTRQISFPLHRTAVCSLGAAVLLAGCHQNISGSYLASDQGGVCWLQLVRTPDNRLTGQLSGSVLKPDGSIQQNVAPVTGAVDGENVTIQGSGFLGLQSFVLSGTLNGNTLTLTGSQSIPLTFKRSTLAEFQSQESALNARSESILKAKVTAEAQQKVFQAQKNFVATVDQLTGRMERFDSEADVHLGRFPNAERGYEAITARIEKYVTEERRFAGDQNRSNLGVQLSNAAIQATNLTEQMHNQGTSLQSALEDNIKPIADQATAAEQGCHSVAANSGNLTPAEIENVNAACSRLESAVTPFVRCSTPCRPDLRTWSGYTSGRGMHKRGLFRSPKGWNSA